jgi:hypothetical protein
MKKSCKFFVCGAILLIAALSVYSYFHVSGKSIDGVSNISSASPVVIQKSYHLETGYTEYVLDEKQIEMLKSLIEKTSFTRVLSFLVFFEDKDRYDIIINDNTQRVWLHISSIGGEYISVPDQFGGKHLKINNSHWKDSLEAILALSSQ